MLFITRRPILKSTKQKSFNGKIYGFDIETYDDNKKFYCASIYYDDDNKWIFYNVQELIDFLKTKRFWNSIIVATNLSFDFFGVFFGKDEINGFSFLPRGSNLLCAKTYIRNKSFNRTPCIMENNKRKRGTSQGKSLTFIDTFNYAQMSVDKAGKLLGIPKLDKPDFLGRLPKNDKEKQIMIDYNFRDSEISKKFLEFLYDVFEDLGATPQITIAGTALSLFKNKYLEGEYFRQPVNVLLEQFEGYYGGRTEVFKRGKIEGYHYYDFNSLYPSVMVNGIFPDPNSLRITKKNNLNYIKNYEGTSKVSIFCPEGIIPFLPVRTTDKLIFPCGSFTGWYSHVELRKAIELGYTIKKVWKTHYFTKTCMPFKGYVTDLYEKRLKYQKESSPVEKVVKLLLNSLYGKFGQKFFDRDTFQPFNLSLEDLNKLDTFERVGDFIRIKKEMERPSSFCIPIWASYVTSYARIKLYDAIQVADPVYCDTDSVITKIPLPTGDQLGELKEEMFIDFGFIVKPKFYGLRDDSDNEYVKIKGVSLRGLSINDLIGIFADPKVRYNKFMKIREAVRRGFIPNEIVEVEKTLSLTDNKRFWSEDFNPLVLQDSDPFYLEDFVNGQKLITTDITPPLKQQHLYTT